LEPVNITVLIGDLQSQIARLAAGLTLPKRSLVLSAACPAGSRSGPRIDPKVLTRQRVPMLAMRLAPVSQVLGMGDNLQVVWIPAGVDAATVV
jgi:hypothetical protein